MIQTTALSLIIALQITAGLLAVRLFWREGRSRAWMLIALVFVAFGMRRSILLLAAIQENIHAPQEMASELLSLLILAGLLLFGVFAIHHLIKSLENTNRALGENERSFRAMVENLPGAVYRCKADTDLVILYFSDSIEALTGYPATDFINNEIRSFGSIIHENDLSTWYARQKRAASNKPYEVKYRLHHANGNIICVQDKGRAVFDADGNLLWLNGFIWDITESVQSEAVQLSLERQVLHAQKLRSLGILSGGIAHDFNNLIMAVLGHTELAMIEFDSSVPAYDHLLQIQRASQRAADLCRQLLAYSGRGAFEVKKIRLHKIVSEILDLLKTSVSKKIKLNINLSDELPQVAGDASQITQVIMNLIINASEAIGDHKGVITLSGGVLSSLVEVPQDAYKSEEMPHGRYVFIEVTDTGCGMSEETMGRIFEPFFTTKLTGRGLGMSAVLGIIHSHKGALWLKSSPGVGTTFRVFLPAAKRDTHSTTFMLRTKPDFWKGSGLVLLVDDEEVLRIVAGKMLAHIGFDVITAANGREAIEIFSQKGKDIEAVLLDLTMPEMDGEETFRELKKLDANVKVIVTSGYSMQEIEERFDKMGLLGALQKPYSLKSLKKILRDHLENSMADTQLNLSSDRQ